MNPGRSTTASADRASVGQVGDESSTTLKNAARLMAPVVRWLLRRGVSYGIFAELLKRVFVEVARTELERTGARATYSSLSVLSGVHRKDVRALETAATDAPPPRGAPLVSQVYTRWLTARRYRGGDGLPKALPRSDTTGKASFEKLTRELSQDVHPRTVLDELQRLGLIRVDGDLVVPAVLSFTPDRKLEEATSLFVANVSDHLATAVSNLTTEAPPRLEQAIFANGLGAPSVAHLHQCAREAWKQAFARLVDEATTRVKADADVPAADSHRIRFGVYFHSEAESPMTTTTPPATAAASKRSLRVRPRRNP